MTLLPVSTLPLTTFIISVATSDRRRGTVPTVWRDSWSDVDLSLHSTLAVWVLGHIGVGLDLRRQMLDQLFPGNQSLDEQRCELVARLVGRSPRPLHAGPTVHADRRTHTDIHRCCQGPGVGGPKPRCSTSMPSPSGLSAGLNLFSRPEYRHALVTAHGLTRRVGGARPPRVMALLVCCWMTLK